VSESESHRFHVWNARAGLLSILALVCAVLVPDGFVWTGPVAAALVGLTLATAAVLGRRAILSLAGATAEREA
jgi:heme exporter protein D